MREAPDQAHARHGMTATILMIVAGICLLFALLGIAIPSFSLTLLFAVLAMIFGGYGFSHLEKAEEAKPEPPPETYEIGLLSSSLKNGDEIAVSVAILYLDPKHSVNALTRITVQLQTCLNLYVSQRVRLSNDPFGEMEDLLKNALAPLHTEMGFERLSLKVIDVKTQGPSGASQGIYFGSAKR
jgi:hypothetical protein